MTVQKKASIGLLEEQRQNFPTRSLVCLGDDKSIIMKGERLKVTGGQVGPVEGGGDGKFVRLKDRDEYSRVEQSRES